LYIATHASVKSLTISTPVLSTPHTVELLPPAAAATAPVVTVDQGASAGPPNKP